VRIIRSAPLGKLALVIGNPGAVAYDSKRDEILVSDMSLNALVTFYFPEIF
jgi:hypothetical protein